MCGSGEAGQLGNGSRLKQVSPVNIDVENVKQVSCGVFHTGILSYEGKVFTTGGNSFG